MVFKDRYPSIFSPQTKAIVLIVLNLFRNMRFENLIIFSSTDSSASENI